MPIEPNSTNCLLGKGSKALLVIAIAGAGARRDEQGARLIQDLRKDLWGDASSLATSRRIASSNTMKWNYRRAELANRPEQYRQFRGGSWLSKTSSNSSRDIEIVA